MKLLSAYGVDDLGHPSSVVPALGVNMLGYTDLAFNANNNGYVPIPQAGKGLLLSLYMHGMGFSLRDFAESYLAKPIAEGGSPWIALGLMIEPPPAPYSVPNNALNMFGLGTQPGSFTYQFAMTWAEIFVVWGQSKRLCVELVYNTQTGDVSGYVNGLERYTAKGTAIGPAANWFISFNQYQSSNSSQRFRLTDIYLAQVSGQQDIMGNFSIAKLPIKTTSLPANAKVMDGATAKLTGAHTVEFDTADVKEEMVVGVLEKIRANSPGPTAAMSCTRTVNGTTSAANKTSNIPTDPIISATQHVAAKRIGALSADYVKGTALEELKLNLAIVDN